MYTFGAIAFAEFTVFWVRSQWRTRVDAAAATSGVLAVVAAVWFAVNVASVLADIAHGAPYYPLPFVSGMSGKPLYAFVPFARSTGASPSFAG